MEIALATISTIPIVLKGYDFAKEVIRGYRSYDADAKGLLIEIATNEKLFMELVYRLLRGIVQEDMLDAMINSHSNMHWGRPDFHRCLESRLKNEPMIKDAITRTSVTLQRIEQLVLDSGLGKPALQGLTKRSMAILIGVGRPLDETIDLASDTTRTYSARSRILSVGLGHLKEIKNLVTQLRSDVGDFKALLDLESSPVLTVQHNNQSASVTRHSDITSLCYYSRSACNASQALYGIASQNLLCQCHFVHLRLDSPFRERSIRSNEKREREEPSYRFSFQLTANTGNPSSYYPPLIQPINLNFFVRRSSKATITRNAYHEEPKMTCEEVISSGGRSTEMLFSGFHFRRTSLQGLDIPDPGDLKPTSVEELILHRQADIDSLDRFHVAIKLALSLVHFYSSPWILDWGIKTIQYFETQETKSYVGSWTPYVSLKTNNSHMSQLGDKNRDVYLLGLLLLQLGIKSVVNPTEKDWNLVRRKCLERLYREMGKQYTDFVRECLEVWGADRSMDLMEDNNLSIFLSHVTVLEKDARGFEYIDPCL